MSIISAPFSAVRLTGPDARKLLQQVTDDPPPPAAEESLKRGRALAEAFIRQGFAVLQSRAGLLPPSWDGGEIGAP